MTREEIEELIDERLRERLEPLREVTMELKEDIGFIRDSVVDLNFRRKAQLAEGEPESGDTDLEVSGESDDGDILSAEEIAQAGPPAYGYTPGRSAVTSEVLAGVPFETFDRRGGVSGTVDRSAAAEEFRQLLSELWKPRKNSEPDAGVGEGPIRGVPPARGF